MGWTGVASNLLCQSERVTHREVMLEQGKVESSRGCDRVLCVWRSVGTGQWCQLLEKSGDKTGPRGGGWGQTTQPAPLNSYSLGTGTIRAKGQESRSQSGVSGNRLPELCPKVTSS